MNRTWESHELTQLKGKSLQRKEDPTTYNTGKSKMRTAEVEKLLRAVVTRTKLSSVGCCLSWQAHALTFIHQKSAAKQTVTYRRPDVDNWYQTVP